MENGLEWFKPFQVASKENKTGWSASHNDHNFIGSNQQMGMTYQHDTSPSASTPTYSTSQPVPYEQYHQIRQEIRPNITYQPQSSPAMEQNLHFEQQHGNPRIPYGYNNLKENICLQIKFLHYPYLKIMNFLDQNKILKFTSSSSLKEKRLFIVILLGFALCLVCVFGTTGMLKSYDHVSLRTLDNSHSQRYSRSDPNIDSLQAGNLNSKEGLSKIPDHHKEKNISKESVDEEHEKIKDHQQMQRFQGMPSFNAQHQIAISQLQHQQQLLHQHQQQLQQQLHQNNQLMMTRNEYYKNKIQSFDEMNQNQNQMMQDQASQTAFYNQQQIQGSHVTSNALGGGYISDSGERITLPQPGIVSQPQNLPPHLQEAAILPYESEQNSTFNSPGIAVESSPGNMNKSMRTKDKIYDDILSPTTIGVENVSETGIADTTMAESQTQEEKNPLGGPLVEVHTEENHVKIKPVPSNMIDAFDQITVPYPEIEEENVVVENNSETVQNQNEMEIQNKRDFDLNLIMDNFFDDVPRFQGKQINNISSPGNINEIDLTEDLDDAKQSSNSIKIVSDGTIPFVELNNFKDNWDLWERSDIPVYFHIPKAGGSTIKDIIGSCHRLVMAAHMGIVDGHEDDMELSVVYPAIGPKGQDRTPFVNVDTETIEGIERAKKMGFANSGLADVVITPFIYEVNNLFAPTAMGRFFTVFRHPIERAVSFFYYIQIANWEDTYDPSLQSWTLEQYASSDKMENNWLTRQLSQNHKGDLTEEDIKIAMEVLNRKFLVGLVSKMEKTLERFEKFFNWIYHVNPENQEKCRSGLLENGSNSNKNKKDMPVEGSDLWGLFKAQNEFDLQLYQYIEILFDEQEQFVAHLKDGFRNVGATCCKCSPPTYPSGGYNCPVAILN